MQQDHGFSIDVEDWFQVANLAPRIAFNTWDSRELRIRRNMDIILDLLAQHKTTATFFVLGWIARRVPEIVREIAAGSHELGCHGENHESLYNFKPADLRESLYGAKALLEDISGCETVGYRAPNFSIGRDNWWVLDTLVETGFLYDSSIFPFKRSSYGVDGAPLCPYRLKLDSGAMLDEYPPTVLKLGPLATPVGGGGYFRFFPYAFTRWSFRRISKEGRPVFFYIHPWEVDPDQPRVQNLHWKKRFMHYVNLKKTLPRLRRLLSDFNFTSYRRRTKQKPANHNS